MADQSQSKLPNPNATRESDSAQHQSIYPKKRNRKEKENEKNMEKKKKEFEYCKVCRLNHDQGQHHKYFPRHRESLSAFLARFQTKIADVRFFLINPSVLRPEEASRNRVWCSFCDEDIIELGSSFACGKAINHLASADHLKNLKHFLWKYGGGMDSIDKFRISHVDVAQWQKKCQSLKDGAASSCERSRGKLYGPSNDIHNALDFKTINKFENSSTHLPKSDYSNGVIPLQCNTNENQIPHSGLSEVTLVGSHLPGVASYLPTETHSWTNLWNSSNLTVNGIGEQRLPSSSREYSSSGYHSSREVTQVEKGVSGICTSLGMQSKTYVSPLHPQEAEGNVHSGAPPPWLNASDESLLNFQCNSSSSSFGFLGSKSGKSHKLNPKRVGAAWAERRKMELEMEKRGKIMKNDVDADWLPNFGRVWQSGTRKESKKEFEKEKQKSLKNECISEIPAQIQPYISKRMKREDSGADCSD